MDKKHILLGITGGIAAYKSCELVRLLTKAGHQVTVVMSRAAQEFIHPNTFQALTGNPVLVDVWGNEAGNGMAHINLTRAADVFLIAPASANTLAKIAHGLADNLITTLASARTCPLAVAPAMNVQMWQNPANLRNIAQLRQDGVFVFQPESGLQACGEVGLGRMPEAATLFELLPALWTPASLKGKKIVLTAGATFEPIDPVRGITNISSGKMGMALARACRDAGADVTLIHGKLETELAPGLTQTIYAPSADDMFQAVCAQVQNAHAFISVAAVADYKVANRMDQKFKKQGSQAVPHIELTENPDILAFVAKLPNPPFCVGFAAESENLLAHARAKRAKKNVPLLVANLVGQAMGTDHNQVWLLDDAAETELPLMSKDDTATAIIAHLSTLLP
ncbi:MAG: bifunctional phosphopantothenoylcysteine decarboxylase/phosphopantothenate--cysteine ligase CoaBC [Neisseriaceae bacterium]|nr:bifunctional phosphopantothenoylcysteine decarboxylase/phosphopantothenate--cysteine ligase CoaBC [Neisseriaceae bacterium]